MTTPRIPLVDKLLMIARLVALQRRDRWSRTRLLHFQQRHLKGLRQFALARSPFYRKFHRGLEQAPLARLPILTKELLMSNFDEVIVDRRVRLVEVEKFIASMSLDQLYLGRYQVVATSGTSGKRGIFLFNPGEWRTLAMGSVARAMGWAGGSVGTGSRGAIITSRVPWHLTARAGADLKRMNLDSGRLAFDGGEPLADMVAKLNDFQPNTLVSYPSIMQLLAGEQKAGRLRISPRHIQCGSEMLTDEARAAIEDAFDITPGNLYATSECGCVAASCASRQGLHLAEDLVLVEMVDEQGRPTPPGQTGARTLITVLPNRTMPLIRYELDDRLTAMDGQCGCGTPYARIARVDGRQGDMIRLPRRSGGEVEIAPAQISASLRGLPIRAWQLSLSPDELLIECVSSAEQFPAATIVEHFQSFLDQRSALAPPIRARRIEQLERGITGKSALIKRVAR